MNRASTLKNWENYWEQKQEVEDVYSNIDRIIDQISAITDLKSKKVMEIGAGTGRDSFPFLQQGAEVYVLDYSPAAMRIISRLNAENTAKVNAILGDAFTIPVADNSMDIVFHQGLLEHFKDPLTLLKENVRVLKPGGLLLVDVPQKYHYYTVIKHILIALGKWFAGWETQFSIHELKNLAEQSGVQVISQYGSWKRPSLIYRIVREILLKIGIKLPLYPKGLRLIRSVRDKLRDKMSKQRWAYYTFLDIGIVARKV
ncbi:MAG: class I SAM-dependent methyltransferase [candidate division KSB1 bacterium]|jgi:ubiquinone/menaquinone biosynthesis C-methylase UbiE|nr:class I SAM-dependent methyltransferase [candidate division KSB1 bacterium]